METVSTFRPSPAVATEPRRVHVRGFLDEFKRIHETLEDRRFAFVLGAGASRSSGIRTGGELANQWLQELHRMDPQHAEVSYEVWKCENRLQLEDFDPDDPAAAYGQIYEQRFQHDRASGYAFLANEMKNADPGFGYSVLAQVLEMTRHRVVITTNFDNLIEQALALYTKSLPLVCTHETTAGSFRRTLVRPVVVKIHRDLLLDPKNSPKEVAVLEPRYMEALQTLLARFTPIFVGYGGNDGSLMGLLESLEPGSLDGGMYWCFRENDGLPNARIRKLVAQHSGRLVGIAGFDELMVSINDILQYPLLDEEIVKRAQARAAKYVEQARSFFPNRPADVATTVAGEDPAAQALASTLKREARGKPTWWEQDARAKSEIDPTKADRIYAEALNDWPTEVSFLNEYAAFLYRELNDNKRAEDLYKRALAVTPDHAMTLSNYALFLQDVGRDPAEATSLYERALSLDPNRSVTLCNYASLLLARGERARGLEMLRSALDEFGTEQEGPQAKCWFLYYCHGDAPTRSKALRVLKRLLTRKHSWFARANLSVNVARAVDDGHPEAMWLPQLAAVLRNEVGVDTLSGWDAWNRAGPLDGNIAGTP